MAEGTPPLAGVSGGVPLKFFLKNIPGWVGGQENALFELAADPEYGPLITDAPHVVRVDAFKDSGVALKVLGVTEPMRQWDVVGELRRRLKKAFDAERIALRW